MRSVPLSQAQYMPSSSALGPGQTAWARPLGRGYYRTSSSRLPGLRGVQGEAGPSWLAPSQSKITAMAAGPMRQSGLRIVVSRLSEQCGAHWFRSQDGRLA